MTLVTELRQIARLPHIKNKFYSDNFKLYEYPAVLSDIESQADGLGYEAYKERSGNFELQTHSRSVETHTDDLNKRLVFGLYPVKSKLVVHDYYDSRTALNYWLGKRKHTDRRMEVGELIIFNPRRPHSLIYYGEETTFMLFTMSRKRR